jgi:hypothetical protein
MSKEGKFSDVAVSVDGARITYAAGMSAEGVPEEAMINVGYERGGVVFNAVQAFYEGSGQLSGYIRIDLEPKQPPEFTPVSEQAGRLTLTDLTPFESVSLPTNVAGLPHLLNNGHDRGKKVDLLLKNFRVNTESIVLQPPVTEGKVMHFPSPEERTIEEEYTTLAADS